MSPLFVLLWGAPVEATAAAIGLSESQWRSLHHVAVQHRLRPLMHVRGVAGRWPAPPELLRDWASAHRAAALIALRQRAELSRIGGILREAGLSAAVLKGGAFVWNGGIDPALRPMRDLDLLVPPALASRTVDALVKAGFFWADGAAAANEVFGAKHLPALKTRAGVLIEVHQQLYDTFDAAGVERAAAFASRVLARAELSAVTGVLAPCPTDNLLHLILHAVLDHQFNNGPLLLVDMALLTAHGAMNWTLFWAEAELLQAVRACQLALRLAERILPGVDVDWRGHAPDDLAPRLLSRAAALMLVDMNQRSALGWPSRLLSVPAGQRLSHLRKMWARYRRRAAATNALHPSNGAPRKMLSSMLGKNGRRHLSDAIKLAWWLKRP